MKKKDKDWIRRFCLLIIRRFFYCSLKCNFIETESGMIVNGKLCIVLVCLYYLHNYVAASFILTIIVQKVLILIGSLLTTTKMVAIALSSSIF